MKNRIYFWVKRAYDSYIIPKHRFKSKKDAENSLLELSHELYRNAKLLESDEELIKWLTNSKYDDTISSVSRNNSSGIQDIYINFGFGDIHVCTNVIYNIYRILARVYKLHYVVNKD